MNIVERREKSMKSLNDIIWNDDIDLEKGKKSEIGLGMHETCLEDSCGLSPECIIRNSYASPIQVPNCTG